jgi:hypothetical protein
MEIDFYRFMSNNILIVLIFTNQSIGIADYQAKKFLQFNF